MKLKHEVLFHSEILNLFIKCTVLLGGQLLERQTGDCRRQLGRGHRRLHEEQEGSHRENQENLPRKIGISLIVAPKFD